MLPYEKEARNDDLKWYRKCERKRQMTKGTNSILKEKWKNINKSERDEGVTESSCCLCSPIQTNVINANIITETNVLRQFLRYSFTCVKRAMQKIWKSEEWEGECVSMLLWWLFVSNAVVY